MDPKIYGGEISRFFYEYPNHKIIAVTKQIQNDSSYVCGAYVIYFTFLMSKGYTINKINDIFSNNTVKNDLIVTNFIYSLNGVKLNCRQDFCPSIVFSSHCRKFCCCK